MGAVWTSVYDEAGWMQEILRRRVLSSVLTPPTPAVEPPATEPLADDATLWRRLGTGDQEALSALFERHAPAACRLARRLLGQLADAEDAVQEAFIALVAAARAPAPRSVRAWILAVTANHSRKHIRAERRQRARRDRAVPAARAEDSGCEDAVRAALAELPERYREPLWLHFAEDMTFKSIAESLGENQKTVESRVARGAARLRAMLARAGYATGSAALPALIAPSAGAADAERMARAMRPPRIASAVGGRRLARHATGRGWLALSVAVIALGGACLLAGDRLHAWFGVRPRPSGDGSNPVEGPGAPRLALPPWAGPENRTPSPEGVHTREPAQPASQPAPEGGAAPSEPEQPGEPAADKALAEAERRYRALDWSAAASAATQGASLPGSPTTRARCRDLATRATAVADLFRRLDDPDELSRDYDTNPSLLAIRVGGAMPFYAVPYTGEAAHPAIVTDDPVGYVQRAGAAGPVKAFIKGNRDYVAAVLPGGVLEVQLVDQSQVRTEKLKALERRLAALRNGDADADALAWYGAARAAYRSRLDERVAELIDRALELDPFLVESVREDKCGRLYGALVYHLHAGNQKQADVFMALIRRRYADTATAKQADAYYSGRVKQAAQLAAAQETASAQQEERRTAARIERAQALGDQTRADRIRSEPHPSGMTASAAPVDVDEAAAGRWLDDGVAAMHQAETMAASPARSEVYRRAERDLRSAGAAYRLLYERSGDERFQQRMVEANQLRFWSSKFITDY
jgi:RNA polymerase sigma-70 factor (ECF subfamily)